MMEFVCYHCGTRFKWKSPINVLLADDTVVIVCTRSCQKKLKRRIETLHPHLEKERKQREVERKLKLEPEAAEKAREKASEKADKENERRDRKNAQTPILDLSEAAEIALVMTENIDSEEIERIVSVLDTPTQIAEIIQDKNKRLQDAYRAEIEKLYDEKGVDKSLPYYSEHLQTDLKQCMSFGINAINNQLNLDQIKVGTIRTGESRKIEKAKTWDQIKKDLD